MAWLDALVSGWAFGGVYGLMALGLTFQYGVARVLNLAYGDVLVASGLVTHLLLSRYGTSPMVVLLALPPVAFAVHLGLYRYLFEPLGRRGGAARDPEGAGILVAFGLSFAAAGILLAAFGAQFYSYSYLLQPVAVGASVVPANRLVALGLALAGGVLCHLGLTRTRWGTAVRAVARDPQGAPLVGIPVASAAAAAFAAGGAICAASGVIVSMVQPINVPMGVAFTLKALVVVMMGGAGNTLGAVLAGFAVGAVESLVARLVSPGLTLIAAYGLLVGTLLVLRAGLREGAPG